MYFKLKYIFYIIYIIFLNNIMYIILNYIQYNHIEILNFKMNYSLICTIHFNMFSHTII